MNFNDILENALELEVISKDLYEIGDQYEECLKLKSKWECRLTKILVYHEISGAYDPQITYARNLEKGSAVFYKSFKEDLRKVNCMDFWMSLSRINDKFNSIIDTEKLKKDIRENYKIIHTYMNGTLNENQFDTEYPDVINAINVIIKYKNIIKEKIETIKRINLYLNGGIIEKQFEIRLLNQENRLDNTINSLEIIKKIYSEICILMNISEDENPIIYSRIESGSLAMNLLGNPVVWSGAGAIIAFLYKVYNDHFSTKAKQEKIIRSLKIRGDISKLIKESNDNNIVTDDEIKQNSLAKLEELGIGLYKNSSCIELNGEKYGEININDSLVNKYIEEAKKITGPIEESGEDDVEK